MGVSSVKMQVLTSVLHFDALLKHFKLVKMQALTLFLHFDTL